MPDGAQTTGRSEAIAASVAGTAFATSLLFLRGATPVPAPVFDGAAALVFAIGLSPLAGRLRGPAAATLARGAGGIGALLLLARALTPPFDVAVPPAAIFLTGAILLQAEARAGQRRAWLLAAGVALLLGGGAFGFALAGSFPQPTRLRAAILTTGALLVFGFAFRHLAARRRWTPVLPLAIVALAVLVSVYANYRSLAATAVENLPLYEWTLAAAAGAIVLARLRRAAKEGETPDAWTSGARRHAQDVRPVYDERMGPYALVVERFVERGEAAEAYREAMTRAAGGRVDEPLARALDACLRAARAGGRGRKARRQAAEVRLALHQDALAALPLRSDPNSRGHLP